MVFEPYRRFLNIKDLILALYSMSSVAEGFP